MAKRGIFISSVPQEFIQERKVLYDYIYADPLLALSTYFERLGTGTSDMIYKSLDAGLKESLFIQEDEFRTVLFMTVLSPKQKSTPQVIVNDKQVVEPNSTLHVEELLLSLVGEAS